MPTYSYACTACEHRFDTVQAFSDSSLTECPECAGRLRKLYSNVGIVFKGSGFYRTDSRAGSGERSDSSEDSKSESKSKSKSKSVSESGSKSETGSSGSSSESKTSSDSKSGGASSSGSSSSGSTAA